MLYYAQIGEDGYCFYITEAQDPIAKGDFVQIESFDKKYLLQKYDVENKKWLGTYKEEEKSPIDELKEQLLMHEELIFELAMIVYA